MREQGMETTLLAQLGAERQKVFDAGYQFPKITTTKFDAKARFSVNRAPNSQQRLRMNQERCIRLRLLPCCRDSHRRSQ